MHLNLSLPPDPKRLAATANTSVYLDADGTYVVLLIEGGCDNRCGFFRKFKAPELAEAYLLGLQDARQASDDLVFVSNPTNWFHGEEVKKT